MSVHKPKIDELRENFADDMVSFAINIYISFFSNRCNQAPALVYSLNVIHIVNG
jgi:hypothetical protein